MTKKQYIKILKIFLLVIAIFLFFDSLFHISGLRTRYTSQYITPDIKSFVNFFMYLWSSASLFLSLLFFQAKSLKNYDLLKFLALFALWHGSLLIFMSSKHYENIWPTPSMYVWIPYYSIQLIIEGIFTLSFSALYFYGKHKKYVK